MSYALFAPRTEQWFALTRDLPQFNNNDLYIWTDDDISVFDYPNEIIEQILHYKVHDDDLHIVFVYSRNDEYLPVFTESFPVTHDLIEEFLVTHQWP